MIMTYDFILTAKHDKNFRSKIDESILSNTSSEICTDIHRLTFFPESQTVTITAKSDTSPFRYKIAPKKITYQALMKMLNDKWDSIAPDEITDLW